MGDADAPVTGGTDIDRETAVIRADVIKFAWKAEVPPLSEEIPVAMSPVTRWSGIKFTNETGCPECAFRMVD